MSDQSKDHPPESPQTSEPLKSSEESQEVQLLEERLIELKQEEEATFYELYRAKQEYIEKEQEVRLQYLEAKLARLKDAESKIIVRLPERGHMEIGGSQLGETRKVNNPRLPPLVRDFLQVATLITVFGIIWQGGNKLGRIETTLEQHTKEIEKVSIKVDKQLEDINAIKLALATIQKDIENLKSAKLTKTEFQRLAAPLLQEVDLLKEQLSIAENRMQGIEPLPAANNNY
jgi:hypothetical protein